jgi:hypothetical protein
MRAIYVPRPRMPPKRWLSSDAGMPGLNHMLSGGSVGAI